MQRNDTLLPQSFYERDALDVARDLLGKRLKQGNVVLRITEVEAYRWPDDSANHCRFGRTARNAPMWGPAGHAYVYLCYGVHYMLNIVTNREGDGAAVLIRSCEPEAGFDLIEARRKQPHRPNQLAGPGKVAAALALDLSFNHHPLYRRGTLELWNGPAPSHILVGPRVGVDYAEPEHRDALWRFATANSAWVSHKKQLR